MVGLDARMVFRADEQVFTTLALLNITQFTMGKYLYQGVQASSESWVSIKRLEAILLMEVSSLGAAPFAAHIRPCIHTCNGSAHLVRCRG